MAATGSPIPWVKLQEFDNNGRPAAGYQLFCYQSGTSIKQNTYSDVSLTTPNSNPIILDSAGRATIYLSPTSYKFVFTTPTDTDPPSSPVWTQDAVPAVSPFASNLDIPGVAGEGLIVGNAVYLSDGSGGNTAGRWYKTDADFTYASSGATIVGFAVAAASGAGSVVTVRSSGRMTGLAGLTAGFVYYASTTAGAVTQAAPTNAIILGKADSTTSMILGQWWGDATDTVRGLVSTLAQTWAGVKTFTSQPLVNIGADATLPATVGGVYVKDITQHDVIAGQTDSVMTSTTIPANMLNANGKGVLVRFGSSVATAGANGKLIELDVGGTQISLRNSNTNDASWLVEALIERIDSANMDVTTTYIGVSLGSAAKVTRIAALNFTAAIAIRTLGTTGAASTMSQTYFTAGGLG